MKSAMMIFGQGIDLAIMGECDRTYKSISVLGGTYEAPPGMKDLSDEACAHLAGEYKFTIHEIEVYRVY